MMGTAFLRPAIKQILPVYCVSPGKKRNTETENSVTYEIRSSESVLERGAKFHYPVTHFDPRRSGLRIEKQRLLDQKEKFF